jgi:uncharacterized membrane protein
VTAVTAIMTVISVIAIIVIIIIIQFFGLLHFQLLTGRSAIETAQAAVKEKYT